MYAHLSERAIEKLALSNTDRIQHIKKSRWIGYDRAKEIMAKLEDLLVHPSQRENNVGLEISGKTSCRRKPKWRGGQYSCALHSSAART